MVDLRRIDEALQRVRNGEREAFREVVHESALALRAYARFFLNDRDAADDVLQEVYFKIFTEIERYRPGTNFMAWAKAMVRAEALTARNLLRRTKEFQCRYHKAVFERVRDVLISDEDVHPIEDKLKALEKCLERLADKVRTLVRLYYFERRPLALAGQQVGLSANAAAVALHRARGALGRCIEQEQDHDEQRRR